jgi:amino acid adenylation domain-containing protein
MSDLKERIAALSPEQRQLLVQQLEGNRQKAIASQILPQSRDRHPLPLSFGQLRLWFLDRLEPDNPFYNIPAAVRLKGNLNVAALERSINEIIARHEVLRTAFDEVGGEPTLKISPSVSFKLNSLDLQQIADPENQVQRLAAEEAERPFDLSQAPLLRATLLYLPASEYILLLTMHHIAADGWSMRISIEELTALYTAFCHDLPAPLPELKLQYADFAAWQRQWLQGEELEAQMGYWKRQLGGKLPILELPSDRPRPIRQNFVGTTQTATFPIEIAKFSQQEKTTVFITLLAAFKILLYRYTGQTDILVGSPIANRDRPEIEGLIGFFVNTLVLRTDLGANPTVRELLHRVKEVALQAYDRQNLPFEKIVEELQPERNLTHNPMFQVMFTCESDREEVLELPELILSPVEVEIGTSKFDLSLSVLDRGDSITATLEYNTDLFDTDTIARMLGHLQTLLSQMVANPQQKLSELRLLTEAEKKLLSKWGMGQKTQNPSLEQLFELQGRQNPDAIAVVCGKEQLTYRELNARADLVAARLQHEGVKTDVLVGICVERSLEMVVGLLSILKAGGAYLPLDPAYPSERLAFMLEDSQAPILLTQSHLISAFPEHSARIVCLDRLDPKSDKVASEKPTLESPSPDSLAYVIYTSGSTGKPKGVQITRGALANFLQAMQATFNLTEQDTFLSVTTLSFDIAALEIYLPLMVGARLVVATREVATDGAKLQQLLGDARATLMQATPATWQMLLAAGWEGSNQLKMLCGGEALQNHLAYQLLEKGRELWNLYGPTETTIWSAVYRVDAEEIASSGSSTVAIGRPIANTQFYILDVYLQPVPVGVWGELFIGGAGLARGYLNQPELTNQKFIHLQSRLYHTGDLARYRANGTIEYGGRIDNQVKLRGFRIELGEIEAVLQQYPEVREAVVAVRGGDSPTLVAYVVSQPNMELNKESLREFLAASLPQYMVPAIFVILTELPLTPNGKVDRRALPEPSQIGSEVKTAVAPRNQIEEGLAAIWLDILRMEELSIHDNFFELGGHSLLATQVISRARVLFQAEIPLRWLFECPTIAQLGDRISDLVPQSHSLPALQASDRSQYPLSFAQQRLWFLDQLEPNNPAYNMPVALLITGKLDSVALEESLNEMVRRHHILRTNFRILDGEIVQVISPNLTLPLRAIDLASLPKPEREVKALELATLEANLPFNLAQDPLVRASLLQLNPKEQIVLLTMHHIVSDAWSEGVFVREISALYTAFSAGKPSPLPELELQYGDFALWQRQWLQGETLDRLLSYWQKQLAGAPSSIDFKCWRILQPQIPLEIKTSFHLAPGAAAKLHEFSRQEGATAFMTLLALLQTLIYRYGDRQDVVVGTDVASRDRPELEPLIGFFINLLVMRTNFAGNPTFKELLARVREVALGAYTHQDLPFAKLVEAIQPERNSSHAPLFQVLLVLQNTPDVELNLGDLTVSTWGETDKSSKFDLVLFVTETETGIEGNWQYNRDIFTTEAIALMSRHFETLAVNAINNPDTRVDALEILTEAEVNQQKLAEQKAVKSKFQKFKSVRPKAIDLPQTELIKTGYLTSESKFPLVITPNLDEFDSINWTRDNREFINRELLQHGAILFRGFDLKSVIDFEAFTQAICPQLFGEYGDLPREGVSGKVYGSTPYPHDKSILFHNESSHLHKYPLKIWFYCVQPAAKGGETPIVDCRQIYQLLPDRLRDKFADKQLMYVRNYIEGLDVSWQDFFHTNDRNVVEQRCRETGTEWEWIADNHLRTRTIRPAIIQHPQTGETAFFNQLQLHHISCLEANVRSSLMSVFSLDNLPRNVYYGDGSPIEDSVIAEIMGIYERATCSFPWQKGDVIMLDNILAAHGRNPYEGKRKIVVAMGEIITA